MLVPNVYVLVVRDYVLSRWRTIFHYTRGLLPQLILPVSRCIIELYCKTLSKAARNFFFHAKAENRRSLDGVAQFRPSYPSHDCGRTEWAHELARCEHILAGGLCESGVPTLEMGSNEWFVVNNAHGWQRFIAIHRDNELYRENRRQHVSQLSMNLSILSRFLRYFT